jgi:hypothetical protein
MKADKLASRANVRAGLRTGLFIATGFSAWATVLRLVVGPGAFERFGVTWGEVVAVYYLAFLAGGSVYGALLPLRRHPAGAVVLGFSLMCPMYLGAAVLFHVTQNESGSWREDLGLAVLLGIIAGIILGIWLSISEGSDGGPAADRGVPPASAAGRQPRSGNEDSKRSGVP